MNSLSYGLIVFLSMILLIQGCGNSKVEKAQTEEKAPTEAASTVAPQPVQPKEETAPPEQKEASKPVAEERVGRSPSGAAVGHEGRDEQSRIELMAAKALAEYKARKERERLEGLSGDLEEKEKEIEIQTERAELR